MEALYKRGVETGTAFSNLFHQASGIISTIKKNASLEDTIQFIPEAVQKTLYQTKAIAKKLKGNTVPQTCSNIWHFVYRHIQYKKDRQGYEQIRSPRRSWHDRRSGVDCDCYSVFISSILTNLAIPHRLRITKYKQDHFQHIYPVVPFNGKHITIDCVTDKFDYEVPFTEKKDFTMELQFLDGLEDDDTMELSRILERNLYGSTLAGKAKRQQKKAAKLAAKTQTKLSMAIPGASSPAPKKKKKGFFKKVLNVVNKVNPVTLLLRNGVLAAMKLNIKNVAKRLRWSYLSPEQATAKGIDLAKFQKLLATRQKLENIFYGAGGKPANLKKAILGGKGNKDKAVNGLGMLPIDEWSGYMNENTPLTQLLGRDIYYSENIEGMEGFKGFGELGEPVTLATVGAAMGVIAGIVAALKQIGDIFKKKSEGSADFDEAATDAPENNVNVPAGVTTTTTDAALPTTNDSSIPVNNNSAAGSNTSNEDYTIKNQTDTYTSSDEENDMPEQDTPATKTYLPPTSDNTNNAGNNTGANKEGFWDKNKKWIKPVAIGIGGLTLIAIGFKLMKHNKPAARSNHSISGIPKKRKKKNHRRKQPHSHTTPVALL